MNKSLFLFTLIFTLCSFVYAQDEVVPAEEVMETPEATADETAVEEAMESPEKTAENEAVVVEESEDEMLLIEEEDEFLISDEEEENILAPVAKEADSEKVAEETIVEDISKESNKENVAKDSSSANQSTVAKETTEEKKTEEVEVVEEVSPVLIDSVRKINFAGNLENYKSPRKAMFRSLLLPGWGQSYAKRYWKTPVFAGVEVGAIIGLAVMSYLRKEKGDEAEAFANANYNRKNFETYKSNLYNFIKTELQILHPDFEDNDITEMTNEIVNENLYLGYEDMDNSSLWSLNSYIAGWNDFADAPEDTLVFGYYFDKNGYHITDTSKFELSNNSDSTWLMNDLVTGDNYIHGVSNLQKTYKDIRSEEDAYYNRRFIFMGLLITNHLVSAIDAFISAKAYNDEMLEKESVWRHIGLENQLAFTASGSIQSSFGIKVRF